MEKLIDDVLGQGGIAVCVCDADITRRDDTAKAKLRDMKEKCAGNERVLICDSMPSIEFCFLIHFLNTSKYYKDSDAVSAILRNWLPEYDKTGKYLEKIGWVETLCANNNLSKAINRAIKLSEDNESYSNVFKAIELFNNAE